MTKKRTVITMPMKKRIRELRALGVTLTRIAQDMGISYETVMRHSSDAYEAKVKAYQKRRYMKECRERPDLVEKRRNHAREYEERKRRAAGAKPRKPKVPLPQKVTLDVDQFVDELLVTDKVILDTLGGE